MINTPWPNATRASEARPSWDGGAGTAGGTGGAGAAGSSSLASCRGDSIGDWLGVVPHVITLSEDITHEDAAVLTQHFWHNIGLNLDPGAALDEALTHCPPAVSEYVVRHW